MLREGISMLLQGRSECLAHHRVSLSAPGSTYHVLGSARGAKDILGHWQEMR